MTIVILLERYFNYVSNVMTFIKFKPCIIAQSLRKGGGGHFRTSQKHTYVTPSTSLMQNDCKRTIFQAMRNLITGVSTMWTNKCQASAVHWVNEPVDTQLSANLSCGRLQIRKRPSTFLRQNLDSSENNTHLHWAIVQRLWRLAHRSLASLWAGVNSGRRTGRRARRPLAWRRFWIVWIFWLHSLPGVDFAESIWL